MLFKVDMKNGTLSIVQVDAKDGLIAGLLKCYLAFGEDNISSIVSVDKDSKDVKWFEAMGGYIKRI